MDDVRLPCIRILTTSIRNIRMAEPPDFNAIAAFIRVAADGLRNAATELEKLQNLPVVSIIDQLNRMEQTQLCILREFRELRQDLGELRQNLGELRREFGELREEFGELQQDFSEHRGDFCKVEKNNLARMINAKVANENTPLKPFFVHDIGVGVIPNFPATSADIRRLGNSAINNLLTALELSTHGSLEEKRNRFRQHIGLAVL